MPELIIFIVLLITWYIFWSLAEKKHFKRIKEKEKELNEIVVLWKHDVKNLDIESWELITSNVVISIDYFKKFISWFVQFFGWRITPYESLLDRARRHTLVELKQKAKEKWLNAIANLKIETSSISKWRKWGIWSVEVLSYATAIKLK